MKFAIYYSVTAKEDLKSIYRYISETLQTRKAAVDITEEIFASIRKLDEMPERHPVVQAEPWQTIKMRQLQVRKFTVFYEVNHQEKVVYIARIAYSGRNIDNVMVEEIEW